MVMTFFVYLLTYFIFATSLDLNNDEIAYISGQLSPRECRRLVASLQVDSYQLPQDLILRERKLSSSSRCSELLQTWYGDNGKKTPFTLLQTRLNQLDHKNLAKWLNSEVLSGLVESFENVANAQESQRVKRRAEHPHGNASWNMEKFSNNEDLHYLSYRVRETTTEEPTTADDPEDSEDEEWDMVDCVISLIFGAAALILVAVCLKSWWKREKVPFRSCECRTP